MTDKTVFRHSILDHLDMLARPERQLAYQRDVPWVDIANDLVVLWFNCEYHEGDPLLDECFSPPQQEALSRFNRFFAERADALLEGDGSIHDWLRSPEWLAVVEAAGRTLEIVAPEVEQSRESPKN